MNDLSHVDGRLAGIGLWLRAPGPHDGAKGILERAITAAQAADRAGHRSLWVSESDVEGPTGAPYEAYSLLGALAVKTEQVHLGVVADRMERRAPSILAKIVTGVDVISHGRALLTLDVDSSDDADIERLTEALVVCRAVLEDDLPTWSGQHYAVEGAVNRPAPVQAGGVPLVVCLRGNGPWSSGLVSAISGRVDVVVVDGGADRVVEAVRLLGEGVDQSTSDVVTGVLGQVAIEAGLDAASATSGLAEVRAAGASGCLIGVPFPWDPAIIGDPALTW